MNNPAHSDLAFSLAKHYFGESVAVVIKTLFAYDQASLKLLKYNLPNLKKNVLRRSLLILVKYQLVDYVKTVKNFSQQYEYSVIPRRVFSFFQIARYMRTLELKEGVETRAVLSILSRHAMIDRNKLSNMATLSNSPGCEQTLTQDNINLCIERLILKHYIARTSDNLCLNIERFSREYRDDLIVKTIHNYYNLDDKIEILGRTILNISFDITADDAVMTAPIPLNEIANVLVPESFNNIEELVKYLQTLTTEGNKNFFASVGVHQDKGPMYALNIGLTIDYLVKEHLSSVITTKFGPKCCRVFKVLLTRGPLLLKQIEEMIMLPARDVREYSYMLIKEGFIRNRQVPKTMDNAPSKSVFIMSVELDQLVYNTTDLCCRTINNLLLRYDYELRRNKLLLDRSKAAQELLAAEGEAPTREYWSQYFNTHEISQLEWINRTLDKLLNAKIQVDETLALLHAWLELRPNMQYDGVG